MFVKRIYLQANPQQNVAWCSHWKMPGRTASIKCLQGKSILSKKDNISYAQLYLRQFSFLMTPIHLFTVSGYRCDTQQFSLHHIWGTGNLDCFFFHSRVSLCLPSPAIPSQPRSPNQCCHKWGQISMDDELPQVCLCTKCTCMHRDTHKCTLYKYNNILAHMAVT